MDAIAVPPGRLRQCGGNARHRADRRAGPADRPVHLGGGHRLRFRCARQKATRRAAGIFAKTGVKVRVLTMTGAKDPDEYLKNTGASDSQD